MKTTSFVLAWIGCLTFLSPYKVLAQSRDGLDRTIMLENFSPVSICAFHASNIARPTWEENILGGDIVAPGTRVLVDVDDGSGRCYFDLLTIFCNGRKIVKNSVDVCTMEVYTITK